MHFIARNSESQEMRMVSCFLLLVFGLGHRSHESWRIGGMKNRGENHGERGDCRGKNGDTKLFFRLVERKSVVVFF